MAETPSWLSQYPEVENESWLDQYPEAKEKPFLDISETASALGRAATSVATTVPASIRQAWTGLENPWRHSEGYLQSQQGMRDLQEELDQSEREAELSGDASTVSSTIREAIPSLGFSGATLLPSLGAGAGALALTKSPNAARGAAAATSAVMAYRMAGAQFLDDAKERIDAYFQENLGRLPNEQEQNEAYDELLPLARKFGAAEAGPEALGNLALGGAGKYIRRALGGKGGVMELASNALGKVTGTKAALAGAGALASEIGTEAVTAVEQDRVNKQFEEGVMRGESPESVQLADRSLQDYVEGFKEVAPTTTALTAMMGAAGLAPTAISRGIRSLRKPQVEAIETVEEQMPPPPSDPGMAAAKNLVTPTANVEGATETAILANEQIQQTQDLVDAAIEGMSPPPTEPAVQPEQEDEAVESEVTPSLPETGMPPVVDKGAPAGTPVQAAPLSEGAERNRAVIAEAYAKFRGKAPQTISAGLQAAIPQQTSQENAPNQIPDQESFRQEPENRVESREAEGAGVSDSLRSQEEVEEKVITPKGTPTLATEGMPKSRGVGIVGKSAFSSAEISKSLSEIKTNLPRHIAAVRLGDYIEFFGENAVFAGSPISVRNGIEMAAVSARNVDKLQEIANLAQKPVALISDKKVIREFPPSQVAQANQGSQPAIDPTNATIYKSAASSFDDFYRNKNWPTSSLSPVEIAEATAIFNRAGTPVEQRNSKRLASALVAGDRATTPSWARAWARMEKGKARTYQHILHALAIKFSLEDGKPVNATWTDQYELTLPEGYVKQGDLYVFQPGATGEPVQAAPSAAQAVKATAPGPSSQTTTVATNETAAPSAKGAAVASAERQPSGGSIPEVAPSETQETQPSTKENDAVAKEDKDREAEEIKDGQKVRRARKSVIDPAKTNIKYDKVTTAIVEAARRQLQNSGEIPNAILTRIYASPEAFLADRSNQRYFPAAYARIMAEPNVEGLYADKTTFVFASNVGVSDLDRGIAEARGISEEQAAARRVIAHENGHRGVDLFEPWELREFRSFVNRTYTTEEIDNLVRLYTEFADWRTNPVSRNEALEELFQKKFERLVKIPTGGLWDDIVQFLKRVWRRLTGRTDEPTLDNMKDVVRLLRNAMRRTAVPSFTTKNGGEVKLSLSDRFQGVTPEQDAEYLAAVQAGDMKKAQRMVDEAANESMPPNVVFRAVSEEEMDSIINSGGIKSRNSMALPIERQLGLTAYANTIDDTKLYQKANKGGYVLAVARDDSFSEDWTELPNLQAKEDELKREISELQETMKAKGESWENYDMFKDWLASNKDELSRLKRKLASLGVVEDVRGIKGFKLDYPQTPKNIPSESIKMVWRVEPDGKLTPIAESIVMAAVKTPSGKIFRGDRFGKQWTGRVAYERKGDDRFSHASIIENNKIIGSDFTPGFITSTGRFLSRNEAYREATSAGQIAARNIAQLFSEDFLHDLNPNASPSIGRRLARVTYDDAGNVIPLSQRFQAASPDIRFSRVEYASDFSAASSAGAQLARDTVYDDRIIEMRDAIRRAYEQSSTEAGVAMPLDELYAKAKELAPDMTENEFGNILQDLYEDNGAVLQEGESAFNVFTPEGRRAGFAVIMPKRVVASRVETEGEAVKEFQEGIEAIEGNSLNAFFGGRQMEDASPEIRTVQPSKFYKQVANDFVNKLIDEGNSIESIGESLFSEEFLQEIGIKNNVPALVMLIAVVKDRVSKQSRDRGTTGARQVKLQKLDRRLAGYWQNLGTNSGRAQGIRSYITKSPEFNWMFIFDRANENLEKEGKLAAARVASDLPQTADNLQKTDAKAGEDAGEQVADDLEDNQDAIDLAAGEATLTGKLLALYEELKDLLREEGIIASAIKKVGNLAKASISQERRNELMSMSPEELRKRSERNKKRIEEILTAMLGKESDAQTTEQKATRKKREKMVATAKKRAKQGKPIEAEKESEEDEVSRAERTAQNILKDLSERYADPVVWKDGKKPNINEMRELYKQRVKQGVGPTQMSEEAFVKKAVEFGADELTAGILWKAAELEIDAREAMRQEKVLDRQRAAGERADAEAQRIIFAKERLKRQSGFAGIENSANKDTIVKAFKDQVENPVEQDEFTRRLLALKVSRDVAGRLFRAAAREKADLKAMEAFRRLEGPNALQTMLREISALRPGEQTPFSKQIPWRKLLSQKASTVEIYRQRIFDAISSEESLANLDDAQRNKLADLFTQAWESKRKAILDRMVDNAINQEEAAGRLTKEGADALRSQRQKLVEDINLGILDEDRLMKHLADKFGIKSEFTEAERANIDRLLDILQDDKLNEVKRNKAAYELLEALSASTKIPIAKLLADYWVSSVLSGVNTAASIAMAVMSGGYELTTGAFRVLRAGFTNPKEVPAEIEASFKAMYEFLKAFGREGRLAWQYLVTGDRALLDPSLHNVRNDLNYDSIGKTVSLAERMAKSDKVLEKVVGIWMRSVSRLLTALDNFNTGVTKAGALPIVFRQLNLSGEDLQRAAEKYNLKLYREKAIQEDFDNKQPTNQHEKALVDSYAKARMMADLQEFGKFSENADFIAQNGAMTLDPTGVGGAIYSGIKYFTGGATTKADKFLADAQREWNQVDGADKTAKGLQLAFAYIRQFIAYNSANLAGLRFARFAGNKFNQGLSFIPGIGMLRMYEATAKDSKIEAKDAFTDMIMRNQLAGLLLSLAGFAVIQAIMDEPDDEKRGWFINGGWANLTPERKQQKLAAGQKEFTIGIGGKVYNYQNWPISPIMAAIGSLSDLVRYSREQWNEKSIADRLVSAAASGVFSAGEIPALSGFQTLFGNNLSSKDPNEKRLDRFAKVMAGWGGGFVPRILKDVDFMTDPGLRKYETLWAQTASHIPVYRRHIGEEYYDILGKQIERKVWPGSREFMELETDPEYRTLGKLNSRGIWLTPANAEHRMIGKGRFKRKLTQEEADAYSLETGKGYRQMLLRYGSRLEQMPTERARAFLMDKADEVRDRALQKITR